MKPICLIPARGGSKGIPRKNIKPLNKKPLIAHTIQACKNSKIFSDVIVSTDDKEIAEISQKYGAKIPFLRPKKLSLGSSSMVTVTVDESECRLGADVHEPLHVL